MVGTCYSLAPERVTVTVHRQKHRDEGLVLVQEKTNNGFQPLGDKSTTPTGLFRVRASRLSETCYRCSLTPSGVGLSFADNTSRGGRHQ